MREHVSEDPVPLQDLEKGLATSDAPQEHHPLSSRVEASVQQGLRFVDRPRQNLLDLLNLTPEDSIHLSLGLGSSDTFWRHDTVLRYLSGWSREDAAKVHDRLHSKAFSLAAVLCFLVGCFLAVPCVLFSKVWRVPALATRLSVLIGALSTQPLWLSIISLTNIKLARLVLRQFETWYLALYILMMSVSLSTLCSSNWRWLLHWFVICEGFFCVLFVDALPALFFPRTRAATLGGSISAFAFMILNYVAVILHTMDIDETAYSIDVISVSADTRTLEWKEQQYQLSSTALSSMATLVLFLGRNFYTTLYHPGQAIVLKQHAEVELVGDSGQQPPSQERSCWQLPVS